MRAMMRGASFTRACVLWLPGLLVSSSAVAQTTDPGRQAFVARCAGCHGTDGNGGELGPGITGRIPLRTDEELAGVVRDGRPAAGMPAFPGMAASEEAELIRFLRTLRPREGSGPSRAKLGLVSGGALEGLVLNQSAADLQLLGDDRRIHLLRKEGERHRAVTSQADWPFYDGQTKANRYSTLTQIDKANVSRMVPKWIFTLPNTSNLQVTPVVVGGVMYVTSANECYALDAGSGRQIWHYQRPRTKGLIGNSAGGANRGVAVADDRVFMVTDHGHLIALNRFTGALVWETEMADWRQNYYGTGAPLVVGNLVISGISGGDEGVRGFLAAYDQIHGQGGLALLDRSTAGRAGVGNLERKGDRTPRRDNLDDRGLRCRARDALLADRQSRSRHDRRRSARRQSVFGFNPRAGSENGPAQVAFSVHAARRLGLRRAGAPRAGRRRLARAAAQAPGAGQQERVLLRAGSDEWPVSSGDAVRQECDVGFRPHARRPSDCRSRHGADARGQTSLPVARWRIELVCHVVQPDDRLVLRTDQRQMRHLHPDQHGVAGWKGLHGRLVHHRAGAGAASPASVRRPDRQESSGSCRRPETRSPGAAC